MDRVFAASRVTLRVGEARHVEALALAWDTPVVDGADAVPRHLGVVDVVSDERVVRLRPCHLGDGRPAGQPVGAVPVVDVHPHVADARRRKEALRRQPRRARPRGRNRPRQRIVALEVAPVARLVAADVAVEQPCPTKLRRAVLRSDAVPEEGAVALRAVVARP
eukprot:7375837-Prymnesium_polylepis.1